MNKDRRQRLRFCIDRLTELAVGIEAICSEEEEAYQNMPEGLQNSDRGQKMEFNVDTLQEIVSTIQEVGSLLEEVIE